MVSAFKKNREKAKAATAYSEMLEGQSREHSSRWWICSWEGGSFTSLIDWNGRSCSKSALKPLRHMQLNNFAIMLIS